MPVVISMLRGINVGGHKQIKMDALRALYESIELPNSQTYIQSGNVILKTKERNLDALAETIENGIERTFGFRSSVIVRTASDLREVIARNPFAQRIGLDPRRLLVNFLASRPAQEAHDRIHQIKFDPEELHMIGREVYIYYPDGMARPKVPWALVEKLLKTPATGRNWNTVTKMLDMAESLERT